MSVVVCVACKPRPCLSYSRHRDRINLVLLRSYCKGGGGGLLSAPLSGAPAHAHQQISIERDRQGFNDAHSLPTPRGRGGGGYIWHLPPTFLWHQAAFPFVQIEDRLEQFPVAVRQRFHEWCDGTGFASQPQHLPCVQLAMIRVCAVLSCMVGRGLFTAPPQGPVGETAGSLG